MSHTTHPSQSPPAPVSTNPFWGQTHVPGTSLNVARVFDAAQNLSTLLQDAWTKKTGRLILVTSTRAGMGKSCVIDTISVDLAEHAAFIPWPKTTAELIHSTTSGSEPVLLEKGFRWVLAQLCHDLILQDRLPCTNRTETLALLHQHPEIAFDPRDTTQPIGSWFYQNFAGLAALFSNAWAAKLQQPITTARLVLEQLEAAFAPSKNPWEYRRNELLTQTRLNTEDTLPFFNDLLTAAQPIVFIADNLDHCFQRPKTTWQLTTRIFRTMSQFPQACFLVALNQDVIESSFDKHLPQAFLDRLKEFTVPVPGLNLDTAQELIRKRLEIAGTPPQSAAFLRALSIDQILASQPELSISPRNLLRQASDSWNIFNRNTPQTDEIDLAWPVEDDPNGSLNGQIPHTHKFPLAPAWDQNHIPPIIINGAASWLDADLDDALRPEIEELPPRPDAPTEKSISIQNQYTTTRDRLWRASEHQPVTPAELASLFRLAGNAFPMVEFGEKESLGINVPFWRFDGSDIFLGVEPLSNTNYWAQLLALINPTSGQTTDSTRFFKIVAVDSGSPSPKGVECLKFSPWQAACIHAARESVPPHTDTQLLSGEAVRLLSGELDFLWRQLTRPPLPTNEG